MKKAFTIMELLVVMVIIAFLAALLLPAIRKSRSKALIDKAKAEMANLASIITMVKLDTGYYVRLRDMSNPQLGSSYTSSFPHYGPNHGQTGSSTLNGVFVYYDPNTLNDTTDLESEITSGHSWDGPYFTFQPNATYNAGNGSFPVVGATGWLSNAPYGTPLDPWGHTYLVAYNSTEKCMIIYSAGPNGKIETNAGDTTSIGDDILYKFR